MRAGKVAGVQILLNNWFILLILLFTMAGLGGKVAGIFACILWHELTHAGIASLLGYKVKEIELLPFGGVARIEGLSEAGSVHEMMIAVAGPLASLGLAAFVYVGMVWYPDWNATLNYYLNVNIMLFLFNLIPAVPLDGGRIVRGWLSRHIGYVRATIFVANISKLVSLGLLAVVCIEFVIFNNINITFIMAALFLYVAARAELDLAGFRTMRVLAKKKAELSRRGVMTAFHLTALKDAPVRDVIRFFSPEQYYIVEVLDEKFHVCGTLTETEVWEGLPLRGVYARLGDFL
ncbi:Hypothetical protein LUCI_3136 [Lucifera butyrica]|uniref:Peptidase M50 domain-containing protein n=1 Tax=Lucifera butyrica TaxID=1351585 RepID=A0A498R912_9FIRM|nr:M50 family metallopeptidase [Lucifera butyrica]VBB07871.1 Hypothetical protein LUCI_3136 [Lucifera butyrica]